MSDEEAHSEHENTRGESELDKALNRQRSIFLDELETRFSSFSAKRSSPDLGFKFKSEGNKVQFDFNSDRIEGLSRIRDLCAVSVQATKSTVDKEIDSLKQRNKILKIADKHGWDTVREYTDSPLADDSEDASNLRAAISRAMRSRRYQPYQRSSTASAAPQQKTQGLFRRFQGDNETNMSSRFGPGQPLPARFGVGPCFACHLYGHFAKQCPYVQRNTVKPATREDQRKPTVTDIPINDNGSGN
ncbi:uncharacterized protein LOC132747484 [Ruditapes philippinarum]|uniref:uncharacterized protein LOC132747484 n=1 Tax=Ruditapes philippinarum TaxID=129788 RepID=UPI00295BE021|nr:uncharacterized protein LOC132747484 [Ruditapes philippinarum]